MRLVTDGLQLSGAGSLRQQLYLLLQQQLLTAVWPGGALLPSSRTLASDLALSRNTVNQAGTETELPGKVSLDLTAGAVLTIATPGGGGWGRA